MVNMTTTRTVQQEVSADVEVSVRPSRSGRSTIVTLNGHPALAITRQGYLRRLRNLPQEAGVRRLPDGRIAIKPASNA